MTRSKPRNWFFFAYKADALASVGSATTQKIARRWQSAKESSAFAVADVILNSTLVRTQYYRIFDTNLIFSNLVS